MLDAARQYLEKLFPWDGNTYASIHHLHPEGRGLPGRPFKTLEGALDYLAARKKAGKYTDLYACMGCQTEAEEKEGQHGKYLSAKRVQSNIAFLKAFYIDIDVKPDKPDSAYTSTVEAAQALNAFVDAVGLPKWNLLNLSGTGGMHVYWVLDQYLYPSEHKPWAEALVKAAEAHGFKIDAGITIDCARVLRIPDTFNGKHGQKLPVELKRCDPHDVEFEAIKVALQPWYKAPKVSPQQDINSDLSAGIGANKEFTPRDVNEVAKICPFVLDALQTGGTTHNEPLWHVVLSLSQGLTDPETAARAMSQSHPDFDEDRFVEKLDAVAQDAVANPQHKFVSCNKISALGAAQCVGCPLLSKESNPLSLTPIAPVAAPPTVIQTSNVLPIGYFYGPKDGFVYAVGQDKEPAQVILQAKFRSAVLASNPLTLHFTADHVIGELRRSVRVGDVTSSGTIARSMADQDIIVGNNHKKASEFMAAFVTLLQQSKATYSNGQAFGWSQTDGIVDGFLFDDRKFTANGAVAGAPGQGSLREIYRVIGDAKYWMEAVRLFHSQKRPALDALIATGFAAPLLRATKYSGLMVGGVGQSGTGKSTALVIASSIWGHPKKSQNGINDTENALFAKLRYTKNLPIVWDEAQQDEEREKFAGLLFKLTRGVEKLRSNRNATLNDSGEWDTLLTYAVNVTMLGMLADRNKNHDADLMRIFEMEVEKIEQSKAMTERMDYLQAKIKDNYGHAGAVYAEFLGANYDKICDDMQAMSGAVQSAVAGTNPERFWRVGVASLLLGAKYANNLGLTEFDIPALKDYLIDSYLRMRAVQKSGMSDMTNPDVVGERLRVFLNEHSARNTVFTDIVFRQPRRPSSGEVKLMVDGPAIDRLDVIRVQLGCMDKVIRLSDEGLRIWLKKKQIDATMYINALKSLMGASRGNGRLGSGVDKIHTSSENVWTIDTKGTPLENKIGWGVA